MHRTIALVLASAVACSESSVLSPSSVEPAPPRQPAPLPPAPSVGTAYTLVLVNGASLPSKSPTGAGAWDYDGATVELVGATLTLKSDGTLIEYWEHRHTLNGVSRLLTQTCAGQYSRRAESTLSVGSGEGATVMTLTDKGLVWELPGFTLTYERQTN